MNVINYYISQYYSEYANEHDPLPTLKNHKKILRCNKTYNY